MPCFRPAIFLVAILGGVLGGWSRWMYISGVRITPHWFQPFSWPWQWKWSFNNRILRGTYKASMVNGKLNRNQPSWEPIFQVVPLAFHSSCIRGFSLRPRPRNKRWPLWWPIIRRFRGVLEESFGLIIAVILVSLYHNTVGFVGVFFGRAIAVCTIVFFFHETHHPKTSQKQFGLMHCYCEFLQ